MSALARSFRELPQVARFLLCGGLAAAVNWSSRFAWSLTLPFSTAVIAAYGTGMVVAFILFRSMVFQGSSSELHVQMQRFVIVNFVGLAATWALANLLVLRLLPALGMVHFVEPVGHAIAIAAPAATSWFGHRLLTFR